MKRPGLRAPGSAVVLGLLACGQEVATRPSAGPPMAAVSGNSALQAQVNSLINGLFAPKDQGAIQKDFARIKNAVASGRTAEAETAIVAFVQTLLTASGNNVLQDPNGAQPPSIPEALQSLVNSVAQFGGLPPPIPTSNPFLGDGAIAVVGSAGGTVVSSTGFGGAGFPPGALPADVIVVVERLPNPVVPGAGPLPTGLTQFPLFYDFTTAPHVAQFGADVTVGICQLEVGDPFGPPTQAVADRLQLAHPDPGNPTTIELLPRQLAAFVDCNNVTLVQALDPGWGGKLLAALARGGSRMLSLFRPSVAWAVHGGLGGLTRSFSPFAAVDPGIMIVGVCGTAMPNVSQTYPTVDIALANVAPGGNIRICPQTINVPATYLVNKPVTIEADDPQNPPQFQVNGATTPVAFTVNPVLQGAVTFRSLSFVHTSFAVAIELGLGQGAGNQGSWWQVLIENSQFTLPGGLGRAVRVFQTSVANPRVTIQNNQMSGGGFAVVTLTGSPTSTIELLSNSFSGSAGEVLLLQNEADVRVEDNTFSGGCGGACARFLNVGNGLFQGNTLTVPVSANGIVVQDFFGAAGSVSILGNSIVGTGGGGPPSNPLSYALRGAAVSVGDLASSGVVGATTVNVSGNTISNAAAGIRISGGGASVTAANNVMSNVLAGLRIDNSSASPSSLTIGSSDFTSYFTPVQFSSPAAAGTLVATCNWWGSAAGPQNLDPFTPATVYVPWATAPVANGAGGACNGVSGTPSISIGSVTVSGSGSPVNLANVSGAIDVQLSVQPSGNTVSRVALFLDGNEVVQSTGTTLLTLNTLLYCNGPHVLEGRVFTVGGPAGGTPSTTVQAVFNNLGGCAALLHRYPFDLGAFTDAVGGATGVPSGGASTSTGSFGVTQRPSGILSLDGTTGYVGFASKIVPTSGSYSVALFARHRGTQNTFIEFISQGATSGPGFYIGHDPAGFIRATDSWFNTGIAGATADGKFHHYALVVDATANQSKFFLDGALQATLNSAITTTSGGTATRFGRQFDPFTEFFAGDLDDIRIYQGALTGSEVATLASGAPSPLTGTWQGQVTWSPSPGFTGEYVFSQPSTGPVTGLFTEVANGQPFGTSLNLPLTISGQGLQFTLSWTIPGGGDVYTLVGTITGNTMTGTASSTSGSAGTFSLTRIM